MSGIGIGDTEKNGCLQCEIYNRAENSCILWDTYTAQLFILLLLLIA